MPIFPPLPRSAEAELLDAPAHDLAALADNLRDLRALDRYLGGTALTWRALWPMLRALPPSAPATLLDVATGGADGPRILAARARRHGYDLRPFASDRLADVLRLARDAGATLPADAARRPGDPAGRCGGGLRDLLAGAAPLRPARSRGAAARAMPCRPARRDRQRPAARPAGLCRRAAAGARPLARHGQPRWPALGAARLHAGRGARAGRAGWDQRRAGAGEAAVSDADRGTTPWWLQRPLADPHPQPLSQPRER